jgi:septal ring factor EnvC (AmiA/AmiB activator)
MKILKWLLGLLAGIGGIIAIMSGGKSNKRVKELKKQSKKVSKEINVKKEKRKKVKKSIDTQKNNTTKLKNKKTNIKTKDVSAKDAADFLKKYANKKK